MAETEIILFTIFPQSNFKKVVKAYNKTERMGYYDCGVGIYPDSVIVLKKTFGDLPVGTKLFLFSGDPVWFKESVAFAGLLKCRGETRWIPLEEAFDMGILTPESTEGIEFEAPQMTENEYMKRYSALNYAYRLLDKRERC